MGVCTQVYLSPTARIRDVATVLGILLGYSADWKEVSGLDDVSYFDLKEGVRFTSYDGIPGLVDMKLPGHLFVFQYEGNEKGERCVNLGDVSVQKVALGIALVKFFGGYIDANDSDYSERDYEAKTPAWTIGYGINNKKFERFQDKLSKLHALESDIHAPTVRRAERILQQLADKRRGR